METHSILSDFTSKRAGAIVEQPIFNALWFNAVWFSAVMGRDALLPLTMFLLLVHIVFVSDRKKDCMQILLVAPLGICIDMSLSYVGLYRFAEGILIPLWLCCLWIAFSLSLSRSLFFLASYPFLGLLAGGLGGTLSYLAGNKLGAISFAEPHLITLTVTALIWTIIMPLFLTVTKALKKSHI